MTTATRTWTDTERIELQRKCVAHHLALENAGDKERVLAETFATEGVFYDVVPANVRLDGIEQVSGFYDALFATFPDIRITITHEYDVPGCCVREGKVSGTHSAEFAGLPASGNPASFPLCDMYIFGDDPNKLVAERAYWDNDVLIRQFRGETAPQPDYLWDSGK